jgi:hypothetical protein
LTLPRLKPIAELKHLGFPGSLSKRGGRVIGLAVAQSRPNPRVEARLLEMWELLHVQKGKVQGARERLATALDISRRWGAHNDARRVERALADLPQRAGA